MYGNTGYWVDMDSNYCGHVNPEIKQSIQNNLAARDFIHILFSFHGDSFFRGQENCIFFCQRYIKYWHSDTSVMFSFVKVSRLPSQWTKSQVSCSIGVSGNAAHRIEATAENIFPATKDHVTKATDAINRGEVIAVPTDTIYGFACDAWLVFSYFPCCRRNFNS